jgi:sterol desaturase/sphingolipid hydroxylase (fatty acid hydroxylase superfamily)
MEKYILNNPKMHIWHHAKALPKHVRFGVNYGLTLSIRDYIFKTDHIPHNGKDIELGFTGDETFPKDFVNQELNPIFSKKREFYE